MSEKVYRGRLMAATSSWGSGMMVLLMDDGAAVPCENAPTCRALDQAFPGFIVGSRCADFRRVKGEEVVYGLDEYGLLSFIASSEDYDAMLTMAQVRGDEE